MGGNVPGGNFPGGAIFQVGVWCVGIFLVGIFSGGIFLEPIEATVRKYSLKQVILNSTQYSQENTCVESFFNKVASKFFIKKRLQHRYFPVNIGRQLFVIEDRWLLSV